jgi:hypothetical protein
VPRLRPRGRHGRGSTRRRHGGRRPSRGCAHSAGRLPRRRRGRPRRRGLSLRRRLRRGRGRRFTWPGGREGRRRGRARSGRGRLRLWRRSRGSRRAGCGRRNGSGSRARAGPGSGHGSGREEEVGRRLGRRLVLHRRRQHDGGHHTFVRGWKRDSIRRERLALLEGMQPELSGGDSARTQGGDIADDEKRPPHGPKYPFRPGHGTLTGHPRRPGPSPASSLYTAPSRPRS